MSIQLLENPAPKPRKPVASLAVNLLRDAADSLAGKPMRRGKTRDLVGILVSHGARAWRASQPQSRPRIRVGGFKGGLAVRMSFDGKGLSTEF